MANKTVSLEHEKLAVELAKVLLAIPHNAGLIADPDQVAKFVETLARRLQTLHSGD